MESISGQDRRDVHASYVGGGGEAPSAAASDEEEDVADPKAEPREEQEEVHSAAPRPRYEALKDGWWWAVKTLSYAGEVPPYPCLVEVAYWWDPEERWYVKSPGELRATANHRKSFGRFRSYSTNRDPGHQHSRPASSIGKTRQETCCDGSNKPNMPKNELRLNLRLPKHGRNGGSTPSSPSAVGTPTPSSQVLTEQMKNTDDDGDDEWPWDTGEVGSLPYV